MDVIHFMNTGNGISSLQGRLRGAVERAQQFCRRLQRRARPADRQARHRNRLRRRPQHPDDRPAGLGQDHARQAHADHPAAAHVSKRRLETTKIHSVAGVLDAGAGLVGTRPFRSPHHTISDAGLIGGGADPAPRRSFARAQRRAVPGRAARISAQRSGSHAPAARRWHGLIARAAMSLTFPARFMLAAAMNPCPCGFFNDRSRECHCTPPMIQRYMAKISGPLIDRIDIHIDVPAVNYKELRSGTNPKVRTRFASELSGREKSSCTLRAVGERALLQCADGLAPDSQVLRTLCRLRTSAGTRDDPAGPQRSRARPHSEGRAHYRRSGRRQHRARHIAEAIQYRTFDRTFWA